MSRMVEDEDQWIVERLKKFFGMDRYVNAGYDSQGNVTPKRYWDDLLALGLEYPDKKSLDVNFSHLEFSDKKLADELINKPDEWLEAATEAISEMDFPVKDLPDVQVRVFNLPSEYEVSISKIRNNHLDHFIAIRCIISKASKVDPAFDVAAFECLRCGHITLVPQPKYSDKLMEPFAGCENTESCGKNGPFTMATEGAVKYDHQYLKVQEPLEDLRGNQPEFITVSCRDEIAGIVNPGERVIITGILKGNIRSNSEGKTKYIDLVFAANSIQKSDADYENIEIDPEEEELFKQMARDGTIKDMVLGSIAPSIYGMEDVKLGLALQLFGGTPVEIEDGTRKRGDIHILLVGDPGTAKSQLLRFIAKFAPRAVEFSGRSTSEAGLTGGAVRDEKDKKWWILPGALTLADGGICCADEIDKMRDGQLGSIHEALEQQMVHISKVVKADLPTRTAFLGAANPTHGRYDKYTPVADQIKHGPAFISRMDLIFIIIDQPNAENDEKLARHILETLKGRAGSAKPAMDLELFRKLIAYARTHVNPELNDKSENLIVKFFVNTRNAAGGRADTIPITARTLEAAFRLSTAHARMRLSNVIEEQDAKAAVELLIKNLMDVGIDPSTGQLDADVIECGTSKSQREQIKYIIEVIARLSDSSFSNKCANLEEVIEYCKSYGIQKPEFLIQKLKERGELITPKKGFIKVLNSSIPE